MRLIPNDRELAFHRFLAELRSNLGSARSVEKTLRFAVRATASFFGAGSACVAVQPPGGGAPEIRFAITADERWDPELLATFFGPGGSRSPDDMLHAPLRRRGRIWGALVLRRDDGFEDWHLPALHKAAHVISEMIQAIDRQLLAEVRSRIDRKIVERLRPRDLFYQILDGLRMLTRYDHSSALLVVTPDERALELVAEQIAWRKDRSWRIGHTLPIDAEVRALMEAGRVYGFDLKDSTWTDWTGHEAVALAALLDYNAEPVPDDFRRERAMLCAPLATRDGLLGLLKIGCQHPGSFADYEVELVKRFLPQVAVAIQRSQLRESAANLEAKVLEAEKKSAMATLARGVAHDVNNTLGGLLLRVQQLRSDVEDGRLDRAAILPALERAEQGVQACRRIFGGMLEFARGAARAKGRVSVRRTLDEALALQESQIERNHVRVEIMVPDDLPVVLGRESDLAQVFLNLVANAVDAMPDGGLLKVEGAVRGGKVEVAIHDTGCGIAPGDMQRVQNPFVTTKPEGSGLGLPICRSLLADMGGSLEMASTPDEGTTARVLLPPLGD